MCAAESSTRLYPRGEFLPDEHRAGYGWKLPWRSAWPARPEPTGVRVAVPTISGATRFCEVSPTNEREELDSVRLIRDDVAMVVIDEKERVPPIDNAALERLGHVLDREGVIAAMLIGSQARGTPGPLSDVDIAVWHEPGLDPAGRLRLQLELARLACGTLHTNEVDIVLLNGAPPLLRHRAIRDAKLLVERDPVARVRLNARTLLDYLDTEPLRAEMSKALRKRIREGRFGRPQKH
jgi:predicted nucleotidyltransferase